MREEQYFTDEHQLIYDLRVQVKQLHAAIGAMHEHSVISADMIAEALDRNIATDDLDSLKVIFCSWMPNHENGYDKIAAQQLSDDLAEIRNYF